MSQLPFLTPLLQVKFWIWKDIYSFHWQLIGNQNSLLDASCPQQCLIQSLEGNKKLHHHWPSLPIPQMYFIYTSELSSLDLHVTTMATGVAVLERQLGVSGWLRLLKTQWWHFASTCLFSLGLNSRTLAERQYLPTKKVCFSQTEMVAGVGLDLALNFFLFPLSLEQEGF